MNDVLETIRGWPLLWAWLTFFAVVLLRAGGTYAIGRGVAAGVISRRPPGPRVLVAMDRVDRWGPPAVTLSFLTVGAQTVINLAAGLARMTVPRYLIGLVPGGIIWATLWTSIGAGAFHLALRSGRDRPEALAIAALALIAVVVLTIALGRRRVARDEDRDTLER